MLFELIKKISSCNVYKNWNLEQVVDTKLRKSKKKKKNKRNLNYLWNICNAVRLMFFYSLIIFVLTEW